MFWLSDVKDVFKQACKQMRHTVVDGAIPPNPKPQPRDQWVVGHVSSEGRSTYREKTDLDGDPNHP